MKPGNVKPETWINFDVLFNPKKAKFEKEKELHISKYKNIFSKRYSPNCIEMFVIKKLDICHYEHMW